MCSQTGLVAGWGEQERVQESSPSSWDLLPYGQRHAHEVTTRHQSNSFIKLDDHYHQGNDITEYENTKCSGKIYQNVEEAVEMAIQTEAEGFTIKITENGKIQAWFHSTVDEEQIGYEGKKIGRCRESKHRGKRLYIRK
jgi:hypothetical protein